MPSILRHGENGCKDEAVENEDPAVLRNRVSVLTKGGGSEFPWQSEFSVNRRHAASFGVEIRDCASFVFDVIRVIVSEAVVLKSGRIIELIPGITCRL